MQQRSNFMLIFVWTYVPTKDGRRKSLLLIFVSRFYGYVGGGWILDFLYDFVYAKKLFYSILLRYNCNNVHLQSFS